MIHVSVVDPGPDRRSYRLRWVDPDTGRDRWKTSKTTDRREAERAAARLEELLNTGEYATNSAIRWTEFRKRFETEALPAMAEKSRKAYATVLNHIERIVNPLKLSGLTTATIAQFVTTLRTEGKSENSIKSYLGHVQALLSWAKQSGLLGRLPQFPKVHRAKKGNVKPMKGRPLSDAEFQAMLNATESVVGIRATPSWQHWLEGLWWSGLRLEESLVLTWDDPMGLMLDFSGEHPMLLVRSELEKGKRDRLLPLAPEFCEFLERTPDFQRNGKVFRLVNIEAPGRRGGRPRNLPGEVDAAWAGTICRRIGKKAKVAIDTAYKQRIKYASAHDLRRSFGTRWARRVMPPVLMQLMRHEDIDTTMRYYVDLDARETAAAIWAAVQPAGGNVGKCSVSRSVSQNGTNSSETQKNAKAKKKTT